MGKISLDDLISALRAIRDQELVGRELPLLKRSWLLKQQRRAAMLVLPAMAIWIVALFVVIFFFRPIMLRHPWSALFLVLYMFCSFAVFAWVMAKIHRAFKMVCPYCSSTLMAPQRGRMSDEDLESKRRCSKCRAIIIDLDA